VSAGSKPDRAGLSKATDRAGNIKVIHFGDQLEDFFFLSSFFSTNYARDVFAQ
jgi:hypothetical protein